MYIYVPMYICIHIYIHIQYRYHQTGEHNDGQQSTFLQVLFGQNSHRQFQSSFPLPPLQSSCWIIGHLFYLPRARHLHAQRCVRVSISAICYFCSTLQHTATRCNILQHTVIQCYALQHTATQCNTLSPIPSVSHSALTPPKVCVGI